MYGHRARSSFQFVGGINGFGLLGLPVWVPHGCTGVRRQGLERARDETATAAIEQGRVRHAHLIG